MNKLVIAYWSQTGNTEAMAQAIGEGAKEKGIEVSVLPVSDVSIADLQSSTAFALGCPSMGCEELDDGEMEPFVADVESFSNGKSIALFGSYGWGDGEWMRTWEDRMKQAGATIVTGEGLICQETPDEDALSQCRALGSTLAALV